MQHDDYEMIAPAAASAAATVVAKAGDTTALERKDSKSSASDNGTQCLHLRTIPRKPVGQPLLSQV